MAQSIAGSETTEIGQLCTQEIQNIRRHWQKVLTESGLCAAVSVFCKVDEPLRIQIYIIKMQRIRRQQEQGSFPREHELKELPQPKRAAPALNKADPEKWTDPTKNHILRQYHSDKADARSGQEASQWTRIRSSSYQADP